MQVALRIEGHDLPGRACGPSPDNVAGYENIHVGVQRRGRPDELLDLQPGDAPSVSWTVECDVKPGLDVTGPYVQGRPGGRFVYLSWGTVADAGSFDMFRRAKLMFTDVPSNVLQTSTRTGTLVARVRLSDVHGRPLCARVREPFVEWSAEE